MLCTIEIGSRISAQGELVAILDTGELLVRDGARIYRGRPFARRPEPQITLREAFRAAAA